MTRKLLIVLAVAVISMWAASASAIGVPLNSESGVALRSQDAVPKRTTAHENDTNAWWVVGTAMVLVLGSVGLALWTERRRPDDGDSSGEDGGGGGGPDRPRVPTGPRGEDPTWGLFEAEFREYVRSLEAAGSGLAPRLRGLRQSGRDMS